MIDHYISLATDEELDRPMIRAWFHAVRDHTPKGVLATTPVDGKAVQLVRSKTENEIKYSVPLTRDLTEKEVTDIVDAFSYHTDVDFKISASTSVSKHDFKTEVEVAHDPMLNLCTTWAKKKHENWRKDKEGDGWRYGPTVSKQNKTHPLLRAWEELPETYRKVDTKPAQELLDLLRDEGYVLVHKDDLDHLLGD